MDERLASPKPDHEPLITNERNDVENPFDDDNDTDEEGPSILQEDPFHKDNDNDQETKSTFYIILLTLGIGGLQLAWCVELASVSPFLLSLGLSKSLLALIWIAGPLGGTLVQPYVGIRSDNCRLKWGRRRPFIFGGALATAAALMFLSWTRAIVGGIFSIFGAAPDSRATVIGSQIFAILMAWIIDFVINIIQAGIRAFIVDCAPTHQQEDANAWASRLTGIGNIIGYLAGFGHLPKILPFLGNTQFRVLCAIASVGMVTTASISCLSIKERDPNSFGEPSREGFGVISFFVAMYHTIRNLPRQIKRVCQAQLFAWIAWFPFLFYTSTYVAEIYANPYFKENPNMSQDEIDDIWEQGTRAGSFTLFIFAITTFIASIVLPMIIVPTYEAPRSKSQNLANNSFGNEDDQKGLASSSSSKSTIRRIFSIFSFSHLRISSLTLRRAWLLSHLIFAALMWCTLLVTNVVSATVLISAIGIPWAITNWAPYALIAAEVSRREAEHRSGGGSVSDVGVLPVPTEEPDEEEEEGPQQHHHDVERRAETNGSANAIDETAMPRTTTARARDQAGVILGIHNVSISAPQLVATLVSSAIFKALQKPRGQPDDDSVGWVFRFAGVCALAAAWMTRYVDEGEAFITRRAERRKRKAAAAAAVAAESLERSRLDSGGNGDESPTGEEGGGGYNTRPQ